jgi:pimeloyl-ACP methyl ester carboxylesterase
VGLLKEMSMQPIPYLSGEGSPEPRDVLICLHCSASSGRQWSALAESLADDLTVLTPDLLGYAEPTGWPAGAPLSLDDEVEHLAPLISAQAGRIHLLGHSYGAAVALQIALRWPDRIRSLTLYEPVRFRLLLDSPAMTPLAYEVIRLARSVQRMAGPAPADAAARFVDYWSGEGAWARTSPARQRALALRMPKVGAEFTAALEDGAQEADYARLRMPVRLLGGDRSPAPVRVILERLAHLLPDAERVTLAGLGHMGPIEAPERIALALPRVVREAGRDGDDERSGRGEPIGKPMPDVRAGRVSGSAKPTTLHPAVRAARAIESRARPLLTLAIAVLATLTSPLWIGGPLPATLADAVQALSSRAAVEAPRRADGDGSSADGAPPLPIARVGLRARVDAQ